MTSPLQLAQDVLKGCNETMTVKSFNIINIIPENSTIIPRFGNCDDKGLCKECKSKALELLTAFISEKEFLVDFVLNPKREWIIDEQTKNSFISRLKELTSAIDLLNKNGVKI